MQSNQMDQKSFPLLVLCYIYLHLLKLHWLHVMSRVHCSYRSYRKYKWTNERMNENSVESCWTFEILNQHDKKSTTKCDLKSTKNGLKEKSIKSVHFESVISKWYYTDFGCRTDNRIYTWLCIRHIAFALATLKYETKHIIF